MALTINPNILDAYNNAKEAELKADLYHQQQLLEKLKEAFAASNYTKDKNMMTNPSVEEIDEQIEAFTNKINHLNRIKEKLASCKFKKGDFAIHKEYGNCVVQGIFIEDINKSEFQDPKFFVTYSIAYAPSRADSVSRANPGISTVAEEDLMPYTEMSKTLYTKDSK